VNQIKHDFKEHLFSVKYTGNGSQDKNINGFDVVSDLSNELILKSNGNQTSNELLANLIQKGINIQSFNEILPSLNEIFIKKVAASNE
jgi:ABC-2 type transport system ATP-binding protein